MSDFLGFYLINKSDSLNDFSTIKEVPIRKNKEIKYETFIDVVIVLFIFFILNLHSPYYIYNIKTCIYYFIQGEKLNTFSLSDYIYIIISTLLSLFIPNSSILLCIDKVKNVAIQLEPIPTIKIYITKNIIGFIKYVTCRHIARLLNLISKRCLYQSLEIKQKEIYDGISNMSREELIKAAINSFIAISIYYIDIVGSNIWMSAYRQCMTFSFYRNKDELLTVLRSRDWKKMNDPYIIKCLIDVYVKNKDKKNIVRNNISRLSVSWILYDTFPHNRMITMPFMFRNQKYLLFFTFVYFYIFDSFFIYQIIVTLLFNRLVINTVKDFTYYEFLL